jgi:hypothetical protein
MVSETTHPRRAVVEPLEAVTSVRFSGSYKRELIRAFGGLRGEGFFIEIRQTDVVQKEFNV